MGILQECERNRKRTAVFFPDDIAFIDAGPCAELYARTLVFSRLLWCVFYRHETVPSTDAGRLLLRRIVV